YPEMTPQRGDEMCTTLLGLPVTQPRGGGLVEYFDALDDAQRGGAELMGLDFVDVRGAFDGHGPCSADPWVAGVADLRAPRPIRGGRNRRKTADCEQHHGRSVGVTVGNIRLVRPGAAARGRPVAGHGGLRRWRRRGVAPRGLRAVPVVR